MASLFYCVALAFLDLKDVLKLHGIDAEPPTHAAYECLSEIYERMT